MSLCALAVTSCSDDDNDFNTDSNVSVQLKEATIRVSEDQVSPTSFNYIPVEVTGEANGPIEVTIEVAPYGQNGAVADKNYVMTTYSLTIPTGEKEIGFQYYPKGNDEINEDYSFEVKIKDVKGAKVGTQNNTIVTLVDNEGLIPIYYSGLAGNWDGVMESNYDGPLPLTFTVETVAEGEEGYGKNVTLIDFPEAGFTTNAVFSIDGVTQEIFVSIPAGQQIGALNHPTHGQGKVMIYPISGNSYTTAAFNFSLKFGFDLKSGEYVPDPDYDFGVLVNFAGVMMIYDSYSAMTFVRE